MRVWKSVRCEIVNHSTLRSVQATFLEMIRGNYVISFFNIAMLYHDSFFIPRHYIYNVTLEAFAHRLSLCYGHSYKKTSLLIDTRE